MSKLNDNLQSDRLGFHRVLQCGSSFKGKFGIERGYISLINRGHVLYSVKTV